MRAVFITGGTTGIGMELAKLYLSRGWKVGVCGRSRLPLHHGSGGEGWVRGLHPREGVDPMGCFQSAQKGLGPRLRGENGCGARKENKAP